MDAGDAGDASASTLSDPEFIASDGARFFVSDSGHARVLVWNQPPLANSVPADSVIGQASFTDTKHASGMRTPDANSLTAPDALYGDGHRLLVVDDAAHRVLQLQR